MTYDTAGRLIRDYSEYCKERGLDFSIYGSVSPQDETTLFCSAGMQRYKEQFRDPKHHGTISNIQTCLRLNDLDVIGDGTHGLTFDMLGLFSFREWTLQQTVDFWFDFLERIDVLPDRVTIHPDHPEWRHLYDGREVEIVFDDECHWSDGDQGGYCTEFYRDGVEIGNIVNTNGDCIDVGFGLDRLLRFLGEPSRTRREELIRSILAIHGSGYDVGHYSQGYVLKKLLRELYHSGGDMDHPLFVGEVERQQRLKRKYERLLPRYPDKPPEWWMGTHGIDITLM